MFSMIFDGNHYNKWIWRWKLLFLVCSLIIFIEANYDTQIHIFPSSKFEINRFCLHIKHAQAAGIHIRRKKLSWYQIMQSVWRYYSTIVYSTNNFYLFFSFLFRFVSFPHFLFFRFYLPKVNIYSVCLTRNIKPCACWTISEKKSNSEFGFSILKTAQKIDG